MKKRTPKIIEWLIDQEAGDIVDVVSIVDMPAIEVDFLKFNEDKKKIVFKEMNADKRIVVGPAMIPLRYIYRYDSFTDEEYYGYFSEDTVTMAMEMFMMYGSTKEVNLNHNSEFFKGISVVEAWQVIDENNDKAYALGYDKKDIPKGTFMLAYKVTNDEVWEAIKRGEYAGFSIEAFLSQVVKMRKQLSIENDLMEIYNSKKAPEQVVIELTDYILKLKLDD
jgi:hypothetical protein